MLEASADPTTITAMITSVVTAVGLVAGAWVRGRLRTDKAELDETQNYPKLCSDVDALVLEQAEARAERETMKAELAPLTLARKAEEHEDARTQLKDEIREELAAERLKAEQLEQSEDDGPPASGVRQRTLPHRGPR